jgi:hypothetical protein
LQVAFYGGLISSASERGRYSLGLAPSGISLLELGGNPGRHARRARLPWAGLGRTFSPFHSASDEAGRRGIFDLGMIRLVGCVLRVGRAGVEDG